MVSAQDLSPIPLFGSLAEDSLAQIALLFESRDVSEGVELTGEGASGYSFFILSEGSAVVIVQEQPIAQLGPGEFFGEAAILEGARRNATIVTTAPSKVLVMFGTEFRRLETLQPAIVARIEDVMRERLAALNQ